MVDVRALQRYLRESARQRSQTTRAGPYTAFFSLDSPDPFLNYAVPDEAANGRNVPVMQADAKGLGAVPDDDPDYALVRLKQAFRARHRKARIEFVAEAFPDHAAHLRAAGFVEHARTPLLCCTGATWTPMRPPSGLRVEPILPTTPWPAMRAYLAVQHEAYGIDASDLTDEAPPDHWPALGISAGLVALREARPVGAGGIAPPIDRTTEITGLATLPAERGRGVSHFLANALAKVALGSGSDTVLLLASDEGSRSAGAPPGFVAAGTLVDWREP